MRRSAFHIWMCSVILALVAVPAWLTAQPAEAPMIMICDITVKPSMAGEFRAGMKAMAEFYAKHKAVYGWFAQMTEDSHCLLLSPISDYSDVGKLLEEDAALMAKDKAGFAAWSEKLAATYESFTTSIVSYKPELSLLPEKPRPGEGNTFVIYDIWSIIPGREQEFEALAKEIAALAKAKGTVDAWACLAGELGCEQPVYFYCAVDKGPAEFWTHNAEMWAAMGSDADIIMDKSTKLLRKRRMQTAWYRAELSYTPKK